MQCFEPAAPKERLALCLTEQNLVRDKFLLAFTWKIWYSMKAFNRACRCSSMAECQLPKLNTRVRCPSPAPSSPRTIWRSRRLFLKSHLSLILSRLLSKSQPLTLGCDLVLGAALEVVASINVLIFQKERYAHRVSFFVCFSAQKGRWVIFQMPGSNLANLYPASLRKAQTHPAAS